MAIEVYQVEEALSEYCHVRFCMICGFDLLLSLIWRNHLESVVSHFLLLFCYASDVSYIFEMQGQYLLCILCNNLFA